MRRNLLWAAAAAVVLLLTWVIRLSLHPDIPRSYRGLSNPIPSTNPNLLTGHRLYTFNCAFCHGINGRGDGVPAAGLRPRPADLVQETMESSDARLFYRISEGERLTAMPAWKDILSEQQRWMVILYLRHLAGEPPNGLLPGAPETN
ncbi:MAG: c-type cytochrome [Bacillota bacterium]